jgi:hypothetical protein
LGCIKPWRGIDGGGDAHVLISLATIVRNHRIRP